MKKITYRLIVALMYVLPLSTFLLVSAFIPNLDYNAYIKDIDITDLEFGRDEFGTYLYTLKTRYFEYAEDITYNNNMMYISTRNREYVVRVDNDYWVLNTAKNEETGHLEVKLIHHKDFFKKEETSNVSFRIVIVVGIVVLATLLIARKMLIENLKMQFKTHARESILISLTITILLLLVLNAIISNAIYGLIMVWLSSIAHYIFYKSQNSEKPIDNSNLLLNELRKLNNK